MKRTTFFAAFACALLTFSLLGCGTSNHLQTITLTAKVSATTGGFYNLVGEGGTLQMVATGNYSSGQTKDLSNEVTYSVTLVPGSTDANGDAMLDPPQTIMMSKTGLLTAVPPFVCSWVDPNPDPTKPSWFLSGSYNVTASFQGVTSQPVFVALASAAGSPSYDGVTVNNPSNQCGPS